MRLHIEPVMLGLSGDLENGKQGCELEHVSPVAGMKAMLIGKPVITTGYSGNLDFTTDETALLVDYKLIPVEQGDYPNANGEMWAEPDIEQAGDYMRKLVRDTNFVCSFAKKGQELIRTSFSIEAMGERYKNRLRVILQEKTLGKKNL